MYDAVHAWHQAARAAAPETVRQRDRLLEALKGALHELDYAYEGAPHFAALAKTRARAAIAECEGGEG